MTTTAFAAPSPERPPHVAENQFVDFDIYAPAGGDTDFHAAWKVLHAPGVPDVVWTPRNGGHWIATRSKLIDEIFTDHTKFSSRVILLPKSVGEQHNLLPTTIDPPEHRPYRNLLNSSFQPKTIHAMETRMREQAISLIEAFRSRGHCNFATEYADILPVQIFLTMFGLPLEDSPMLVKLAADSIRQSDTTPTMTEILDTFSAYLQPYIDARRGKDGEDMISRMVNGRIGDRPLTNEEALQLTVQVLIAGVDTVTNFLGFTITFLGSNPQYRDELAANPDLIPAAIEEILRRFPLVTIGREVVQDMEYHGAQLKKGDMITTATILAGLDDTVTADPMRVDFHRPSMEHISFGAGPHRCPGAHLARTEVRITLEELLKRIPDFRTDPSQKLVYKGGITATVSAMPLVWDPAAARGAAA